jgi:hypothetical protein
MTSYHLLFIILADGDLMLEQSLTHPHHRHTRLFA